MICWGGLSFVTVAASGWQMVVRYSSSGGNLVRGTSVRGRRRIDREKERQKERGGANEGVNE